MSRSNNSRQLIQKMYIMHMCTRRRFQRDCRDWRFADGRLGRHRDQRARAVHGESRTVVVHRRSMDVAQRHHIAEHTACYQSASGWICARQCAAHARRRSAESGRNRGDQRRYAGNDARNGASHSARRSHRLPPRLEAGDDADRWQRHLLVRVPNAGFATSGGAASGEPGGLVALYAWSFATVRAALHCPPRTLFDRQ